MRLISYHKGGDAGVGVMVDDKGFVALGKAAPDLPKTMRGILELDDGLAKAAAAVKGKSADESIDNVELDPVVTDPRAIWCLALNFQEHIDETGLTTNPDFPHLFLRLPQGHVGHNQPIVKSKLTNTYDYEGEICAIIGKKGRYLEESQVPSHIAGFTCYNEGSVREFQRHNRNFGIGKTFWHSGSVGPWLMTSDEFGDWKKQRVITRLNGDEKQNTVLGEMIFSVERIISYISQGTDILPGDMIVCGTPGALPGKKAHMNVGDVCEVEVTGLGVLRNEVVADA